MGCEVGRTYDRPTITGQRSLVCHRMIGYPYVINGLGRYGPVDRRGRGARQARLVPEADGPARAATEADPLAHSPKELLTTLP